MSKTTSINTPRYTTLEEAIEDFDTVGNTTAIVLAILNSVKPSEVTAAVAASSYYAGIYGEGEWDLPSVGHMKMIHDNKAAIISILTTLTNKGLSCMGLVKILQNYGIWTSTIVDDTNIWTYSGADSQFVNYTLLSNRMVLPIHVIE